MTTYPDFMTLPRGIKKLLLASENHFFAETAALLPPANRNPSTARHMTQNQWLYPVINNGMDGMNATAAFDVEVLASFAFQFLFLLFLFET
jgi:hypothetical protein